MYYCLAFTEANKRKGSSHKIKSRCFLLAASFENANFVAFYLKEKDVYFLHEFCFNL